MTDWIEALSRYAFEAGYAGLFALSVVDSIGVPTSGGPDVVVVLLAALRPDPLVAATLAVIAAVGSTAGCLGLYGLGRRGGRLRWFASAEMDRARHSLERHGAWVVFLAMLAPPPIPTKLFVLCAGIVRVSVVAFVGATVAGRLLRYGLGAALGLSYGPRVLDLVREDLTAYAPVLGLLVLLAAVVIALRWRRSRADRGADAER